MNVAHASARRGEHHLRPLVGDRAVVAARKTAVRQLRLTVSAARPQMVTVAEINERMLIAEVVRRLTRWYAQLPADHISTAVHNAHARFTQSPFRRGPGAARGQSEIFDEGQVLVHRFHSGVAASSNSNPALGPAR